MIFAGVLEVVVLASILIAAGIAVGILVAWSRPSVLRAVEHWWRRLDLP